MGIPMLPPKDRRRAKEVLNLVHDAIIDELPSLTNSLIDLAKGLHFEERLPNGNIRRYTERPDREALEYLMNRVLGKPAERVELGEAGDFTYEQMVQIALKERMEVIDITARPIQSLPEPQIIVEPPDHESLAQQLLKDKEEIS